MRSPRRTRAQRQGPGLGVSPRPAVGGDSAAGSGSSPWPGGVPRRHTQPTQVPGSAAVVFLRTAQAHGSSRVPRSRLAAALSPGSTPKPGTQMLAKGQPCSRLSHRTFKGGGPGVPGVCAPAPGGEPYLTILQESPHPDRANVSSWGAFVTPHSLAQACSREWKVELFG